VSVSVDQVSTSSLSLKMESDKEVQKRCDTGRIGMKNAANNRAQSEKVGGTTGRPSVVLQHHEISCTTYPL
jgi:hypothetical protein